MLNEKEIKEAAKNAAIKAHKKYELEFENMCDYKLGFEQAVQWALEQVKQNQFWVIESDCGLYKHLFLSKEDAKLKLKELQALMPNKLFRNFPIKIDND